MKKGPTENFLEAPTCFQYAALQKLNEKALLAIQDKNDLICKEQGDKTGLPLNDTKTLHKRRI